MHLIEPARLEHAAEPSGGEVLAVPDVAVECRTRASRHGDHQPAPRARYSDAFAEERRGLVDVLQNLRAHGDGPASVRLASAVPRLVRSRWANRAESPFGGRSLRARSHPFGAVLDPRHLGFGEQRAAAAGRARPWPDPISRMYHRHREGSARGASATSRWR